MSANPTSVSQPSITSAPPIVLCIGGHDPSGGAGIQADAEAVRAAGAWPCMVVSCLTTQDTCGVRTIIPQPPDQVIAQCRLLLADSMIAACKIGLIGSAATARALVEILDELPDRPVVIDPVLASGAGDDLTDAALLEALRRGLLPRATVITPNLPEARTLAEASDPSECATKLLATGCAWVLLTGTHDATEAVINRLHGTGTPAREWLWPRLPHTYHGSGCTLASHLAGLLARGFEVPAAAEQAQSFTWGSLKRALKTGRCQWTPNRWYAGLPDAGT